MRNQHCDVFQSSSIGNILNKKKDYTKALEIKKGSARLLYKENS